MQIKGIVITENLVYWILIKNLAFWLAEHVGATVNST